MHCIIVTLQHALQHYIYIATCTATHTRHLSHLFFYRSHKTRRRLHFQSIVSPVTVIYNHIYICSYVCTGTYRLRLDVRKNQLRVFSALLGIQNATQGTHGEHFKSLTLECINIIFHHIISHRTHLQTYTHTHTHTHTNNAPTKTGGAGCTCPISPLPAASHRAEAAFGMSRLAFKLVSSPTIICRNVREDE